VAEPHGRVRQRDEHYARLFVAAVDLQLTAFEKVGEAILAQYDRTARA
jgi:hypothetical protein